MMEACLCCIKNGRLTSLSAPAGGESVVISYGIAIANITNYFHLQIITPKMPPQAGDILKVFYEKMRLAWMDGSIQVENFSAVFVLTWMR